ncbi:MAG TPA: acyltransferase [Sulfuricurvum sp.]|nr:acyltransferase [Sulfuricurvum sp.]
MNSFRWIDYLRNKIRIASGNRVTIGKALKMSKTSIKIKGKGNHLIIGERVKLRSSNIEIFADNALVSIGAGTMIGHHCHISVLDHERRIVIGEECGLSRHVKVMCSDGHPICQNGKQINEARDIVLGDHIWIGDSVTILKGVRIGSGSVIGINATVTRSIPEASIAVGNPAKVVKENITWQP